MTSYRSEIRSKLMAPIELIRTTTVVSKLVIVQVKFREQEHIWTLGMLPHEYIVVYSRHFWIPKFSLANRIESTLNQTNSTPNSMTPLPIRVTIEHIVNLQSTPIGSCTL